MMILFLKNWLIVYSRKEHKVPCEHAAYHFKLQTSSYLLKEKNLSFLVRMLYNPLCLISYVLIFIIFNFY